MVYSSELYFLMDIGNGSGLFLNTIMQHTLEAKQVLHLQIRD